jgi:hypothetical protein
MRTEDQRATFAIIQIVISALDFLDSSCALAMHHLCGDNSYEHTDCFISRKVNDRDLPNSKLPVMISLWHLCWEYGQLIFDASRMAITTSLLLSNMPSRRNLLTIVLDKHSPNIQQRPSKMPVKSSIYSLRSAF